MKLDRGLQREILVFLKEQYGQQWSRDIKKSEFIIRDHFDGNLAYLCDHELVKAPEDGAQAHRIFDGKTLVTNGYKITADGMDFLEDDGGLGAILNTVTVKLEVDQFRALIEAKVEASNLPPERKKSIMDKLAGLGSEGLKHAALKLIEKGVEHADDLLPLLGG